MRLKKYLSLTKAKRAVRELGIKNWKEYHRRYKEIDGLPSNPHAVYEGSTFHDFFIDSACYPNVHQASCAALRLGIKTLKEYEVRFCEDPLLPKNPAHKYSSHWMGFKHFFKVQQGSYQNLLDAAKAVGVLGITNFAQYRRGAHLDDMLPSWPEFFYGKYWKGWDYFFHNSSTGSALTDRYYKYSDFKGVMSALNIANRADYMSRASEDVKLPERPDFVYASLWTGWQSILEGCGGGKPVQYSTWQEAKAAITEYRPVRESDYRKLCANDKRLPLYVHSKWKDFPGMKRFLIPESYRSLEDVRAAVKILGIKDQQGYSEARKYYGFMPEDPSADFSLEWNGWDELCFNKKFYTYKELQRLVCQHGCKTMPEYSKLRSKLQDFRMPVRPCEVYLEWKDSFSFLMKEPPYGLDFIEGCGKGWIPSIKEFLKNQRAADAKESYLCRFLRQYIEPNKFGDTPEAFLVRGNIDVRGYRDILETQGSLHVINGMNHAINSYLDHILLKNLTVEDGETSELVRVDGAVNPFRYVVFDGAPRPTETVKPSLPYQYVNAIKKWIVPDDARSFDDLKNIHQFEADYFEVDESLINPTDPDCVYKIDNGRYYIWYPGFWMATYTLVSVPARGRQILYNDSGEADEYFADLENELLVWRKNSGSLAEVGTRQGFIQRLKDDDWGLHFTSNKTSFDGSGYDVPWVPGSLGYWMVILRKWQEKYNPISRKKPWSECQRRTNLNVTQLKRKGSNCFLFRAMREEEPPAVRLSDRLAAALYHTQPRGLTLATFDPAGHPSSLSRYDSKYTPHSMRVSLITAFVFEFGLPVEIVMKLAGHASIVMNLYYVKLGSSALRRRMEDAEKIALRDQVFSTQAAIEQQRLDGLIHQMVANSEQALFTLKGAVAGSSLVRDYGICPYAGARCGDGGPFIGSTQARAPAPAGYLGIQNCVRCRHFVTGPVFLGGLVSLWNEISLRVNIYSSQYGGLESEIEAQRLLVKRYDDVEYECAQKGENFDSQERRFVESNIRKLYSELESSARKIDMFLTDLQSLTKLIWECKTLVGQQAQSEVGDDSTQLLLHSQSEVYVDLDETSLFQQLDVVCKNAVIYQSASAEFATTRRSQMIDRMSLLNNIRPVMCQITEREQLVLGNQVTAFLYNRLKSWSLVDVVIEGKVLLRELSGGEANIADELASILSASPVMLTSSEGGENDTR